MHFLRPEFLWLLLLLPTLYWLQYTRQRSIGSWSQLIAKQLQPYMLSKTQKKDAFAKWYSPLLMLILVLIIIALSGPSWKKHQSDIYDAQSGLVIALDLSLSMTAQDVAPSRLQRAKFKIIDVLDQYPDMNTALMAYAGDAHVASPLTKDNKTVKAMLSALDPYIMPEPGSNLIRLVEQASELFEQGQTQNRQLLLVTDGVEQQDIMPAAELLNKANIQLSILAIGTEQGAPIVKPSGQFFKDAQGQVIMPGLELSDLQTLAEQSNAKLMRLRSDDRDIQYLIRQDINSAVTKSDTNIVFDQWADNGNWFLWLALPFTLLLFRRGIVLGMALVILLSPNHDAWAEPYENTPNWLLNDDQQARKILESKPEQAATLFDDPKWQASSHYKAGEYEKALEKWQQFDDANSLYNQGNALSKLNRFDEAINAYQAALEKSPDHEKAKFNKQLIEQIQQQQQNQQQGQQENANEQNNSDQQSSSEQNSDNQSDQQSDLQSENQSDNNSKSPNNNSQQDFDEKAASENPNKSSDDEQESDIQNQQQEKQQDARNTSDEQKESQLQQDEQKEPVSQQSTAQRRQQSEHEQAMQQWMERIPDDPGGLLRNKFLYQYKNRNRDESNGDRKPW
ncbi:VWA domain-containing protein [Bermanella marisrubri]|uniref:VWFA domain-containing protein n=1 Tax=Bermanella marisrubri TaxID=207949 RepID=Q1N641_9GAMM|nr:VWA domain-containing protein [Bermanella marisrubri]EAT13751.1 hypothetical protein RED65_10174 [Oceanobacter sp. RED65] [Bermanella marisrubri]QIZ84525.1 VWA domain-containing protein [Bermanella marisrubri]